MSQSTLREASEKLQTTLDNLGDTVAVMANKIKKSRQKIHTLLDTIEKDDDDLTAYSATLAITDEEGKLRRAVCRKLKATQEVKALETKKARLSPSMEDYI